MTIEDEIDAECRVLSDILKSKNKAYGGAVFKSPVIAPHLTPGTAILVRMSDKIERLKTLANNIANAPNDNINALNAAIDDSISDLAGYCVLLRIERRCRGNFDEPTKK